MALVAILVLVAMVPLAASLHVIRMANTHVTTPSDAIVVLGAAQFNGTPTPVFANRLDHARELYNAGVAPTIITVGGKQPGDVYTEADAGRSYLMESGVPAQSIIAVEDGSDTLTSLTPVATVMAELGLRDVTIVSDPTHMARSLAIADRLGMSAQPNGTNMGDGTNVTAEYVSRETVGYLYFLLAEQWPVSQVLADPAN
jgi:vancomycin permeability regulator SanA